MDNTFLYPRRGMKITALVLAFWLAVLPACSTTRYIADPQSLELQKDIRKRRALRVFGDTFLTAGSFVLAALTGIYIGYSPGGQGLKRIALDNTGPDTLQVCMLTDVFWKDSTYADFMNMRIPPGEKARLLVPAGAVYNLYFSNTFDTPDDDEFIQFDTSAMRKTSLYPGMTFFKDTPAGEQLYPDSLSGVQSQPETPRVEIRQAP